jgi:hypothetical protein
MNSRKINEYIVALELENESLKAELKQAKSLLAKSLLMQQVGGDASAFLSASYPGDPAFTIKEYMTLKFIQSINGNGSRWTVDERTRHHLICAALLTMPVDFEAERSFEERALLFVEQCFRQWLGTEPDFPTSESSMADLRKTLQGRKYSK